MDTPSRWSGGFSNVGSGRVERTICAAARRLSSDSTVKLITQAIA
jgi:hypothetical protein